MSIDTFADVGDDDQDDTTNETEPSRYSSVYDGLTGFGPGGDGRSWAAKGGHPPLFCPDPRFMPNARGLYYCPGCGIKIRHHTNQSAAEWAATELEPALQQAWDVVWPSLQTLTILSARAIAWMARAAWNLITRHRQETASAIVDQDRQPDRQRTGSQGQSTPQSSSEEKAQPPDTQENARQITCTTSDGIHVMKHDNGREKCIECGVTLVRETT